MDEELKHEIDCLVRELAEGRFDDLALDGRAGRLSAAELRGAVADYGRQLIPLPAEAWASIQEYRQGDAADRLAIDVTLWTVEEGRSDLTLSVTASHEAGGWLLAIDDLHVL